jgi:hypothetical protein
MSDTPELIQEVQDVPELDMAKYEAPSPAKLYTEKVSDEVALAADSLTVLREEAKGLTIAGLEDKDGYAKVQVVLTKLTKARTRVDKVLKAARDPFNNAAKKIKALFDQIEANFKAVEGPLAAEKAKIDNEVKRLAQEKIDAERNRVLGLQKSLADFGHFKTIDEIAVLSDQEFQALLAKVKADWESEQKKKRDDADEMARLRAENARLAANQTPAQAPTPAPASVPGGVGTPNKKPSRVYVASSWRNQVQQSVVHGLRELGLDVYDFKNPGPGDNGFHWSAIDPNWEQWQVEEYLLALQHPIAKFGFQKDWNAMEWADIGVLVLPCGRSAHLEAGYFVGVGKPLYIVMGDENPIVPELMYKMATAVFPGIASLMSSLEGK